MCAFCFRQLLNYVFGSFISVFVYVRVVLIISIQVLVVQLFNCVLLWSSLDHKIPQSNLWHVLCNNHEAINFCSQNLLPCFIWIDPRNKFQIALSPYYSTHYVLHPSLSLHQVELLTRPWWPDLLSAFYWCLATVVYWYWVTIILLISQ